MEPPPARRPIPTLDILPPSTAQTFKPTKRINEGSDVAHFLTSLAYRDICTFVLQLNHSVCPRVDPKSSLPRTFPLTTKQSSTPSIQALQNLLKEIQSLLDEAPPDPGPRRFGNVSFRKWYSLLEERVDVFLGEGVLSDTLSAEGGKEEVKTYLLGSFGSATRLDYGTGHELSFVAFLGCLWKLGYFQDGHNGGDIEREIVLQVIESYLRVVRKLILTYTLEPAGSHGVWGLDDHAFLPYIFGSAQLTRPISDSDPIPQEGSARGAPKPSAVTKPTTVEDYRQSNMYFAAIGFINDVKKGPFWEHSPMLFDISGIKDGWGKINKGMIKMFNAEVLSKFPVVQHFPFGSLFSWDKDPDAQTPEESVHMRNQPAQEAVGRTVPPPVSGVGTTAPWVQGRTQAGASCPRSMPPGPSHGSLAGRQTAPTKRPENSTEPQINATKVPWTR